ncbi:hypothetical protein AC578_1537 [Pseudocercospora eumusae]|uniref:RING-type domain-containing protein n=1 Tax=Pseudocercospora eumusae TaxID=321146 RepID=A0A139HM45_9PEZI|nr:hypothetical protein AC578_1537 [Pseudocercospora eumusae]
MEHFSDQLRTYICTICNDHHETPGAGVPTIANHAACHQCIKDLFEHSIASESNWPPTWGRQVLDPEPYERMLGQDFMQRFRDFQVEHECPANERVFCSYKSPSTGHEVCGAFLGRQNESINSYRCKRCKKCNAATCLRCSETFSPSSNENGEHMATAPVADVCIEHRCDPSAARLLRDQAFRGLRRGRHFQDCPRCRRRTELMDGCNHITCPCGESYCYICGKAVTENSDHWDRRRRGCPRYGQLGSRTAIYTDDIEGFGADADEDIGFGSNVSSADDDDDSDYVPSDHGDMLLDEDRARWQMQVLLEQQARREQRRDERTERRIRRGRAHIRELARQRDLPVQATIGIGNEIDHGRQLWESTLESATSDDETQVVAEREPWNLRIRSVHSDAVRDHDPQATSGAATRSPDRLTQHNRFPHRPQNNEERRIWQFGQDYDRARSRDRIAHRHLQSQMRNPSPSPPQPLPRGSHNRRMYENIALQRALHEGPSRDSFAPAVAARSNDPDSPRNTILQWRRDDRGSDWDYYVERSRRFEQLRPTRRRSSVAGDRPGATAHVGSRRGSSSGHGDDDEEEEEGWRDLPSRIWRYSQRVGGAILNSRSRSRS